MYQDPEMNTRRTGGAKRERLPLFENLPLREVATVSQDVASSRREPLLTGDETNQRWCSGSTPTTRRELKTPLAGGEVKSVAGAQVRILPADSQKIRQSKRQKIEAFFAANLGAYISTVWLHQTFGPSFRSRVSDINKDEACPIVIKQTGKVQGDKELSHYWSEKR